MTVAKMVTAMQYKRKPRDEGPLVAELSHAIRKEPTRLDGVVQDLVNGLDILIWRRMKDNDNSAKETDGAAELAQHTQFLLEEIGTQDSTNQHRQGS